MKEKNLYLSSIIVVWSLVLISTLISIFSIFRSISIYREYKSCESCNKILKQSLVLVKGEANKVKENLGRFRNYRSEFSSEFGKLSDADILVSTLKAIASRFSIYQASSNQQDGVFSFEMQGSWDNLIAWVSLIEKEFIQIKIEETNFLTVGGDQITLVLKIKFLTPEKKA